MTPVNLKEVRDKIDQIDEQLLELFQQRMACAVQVAQIKKEQGLPILNPQREQEILESVKAKAEATGGNGAAAQVLFSTLMETSRSLQHDLLQDGEPLRRLIQESFQPQNSQPQSAGQQTVACAGAPGAYASLAAGKLFPGQKLIYREGFADIFAAIDNSEADIGVLPVENSLAGSVIEVYDLLQQHRCFIVGAIDIPVHHCLAAPAGAELPGIKAVYSHPQALSQCSRLIQSRGYRSTTYSTTAAAAALVAQKGDPSIAAICSKEAAQSCGLSILEENVQNYKHNCTRFIAVARSARIPEDAEKISLCFSLPHTTGSLHQTLGRFALHGLNLTKIESRPIAGKAFEYLFYLDFTGNVHDETICNLLCSLSEELPSFSFLGNYWEIRIE